MFCTECGKKNRESSNFCEYCGTPMKYKDHAADRPAGEPLPAVTPVPNVPPADPSRRASPVPMVPGRSASKNVTGGLFIFCLVLMLVFPIVVLKRSVDFYRAAGATAPDSDTLFKADESAAALGNRNVATRWGRFDRSILRWAKCALVLDLAMAVCSAWIGYNILTQKPQATLRARQFMLVVALWIIVRDRLLPRAFDLEVEGNKLSMIVFLAVALAGYVYLKRSQQNALPVH